MATQIVKSFKFPGSDNTYQVNAVYLDGELGSSIKNRISELEDNVSSLTSFDALRYMGTIAGSTTSPGGLTPAANKGDVYKVTTAGYVMGAKVEVGDMLICNTDSTSAATSTNYTTIAAKWDIIQANIDVNAILAHTHDVNLTKTAKNVSHTVTPTTVDVSASFSGGSSSVTGDHGHTASVSVDNATAGGTIGETSITPAGTVKLTAPTTKGTNDVDVTPAGSVNNSETNFVTGVTVGDHAAHKHTGTTDSSAAQSVSGSVTIKTGTGTANYTPGGTVNNSTGAVTNVTIGDLTVSSHEEATTSSAGGFTPAGTVTNVATTAGGTVASHTHSVGVTLGGNSSPVQSISTTYTESNQLLELSYATSAVTAAVSETSVAPTFTGTPHNHTASFKGTAVGGHSHTVTVADHDTITPVLNVTKGNHNHTFSGTPIQLVATHSLTAAAHTHGFTTDDGGATSHTVTAPTTSHNHTFTGSTKYIHGAFTGTAAKHTHDFTGSVHNHTASGTVNEFTGNFTGTATGTVGITNGKGLLKGITISNHSITTVDSATTDEGEQN